jgi:uncharacterized protein YPO0396
MRGVKLKIGQALNRYVRCVVLLQLAFNVHAAAAQDVKDFENAINYAQNSPKGTCWSIPYADYRAECIRKQAEVDKWCEGWGCKGLDPFEKQRKLEELKTLRDATQVEKGDLEQKMSSLTDDTAKGEMNDKIDKLTESIKDIEGQQAALVGEIEEATRKINDQLFKGKACRDARVGVNEVFQKAKSKAGSESDTLIAPLAQRLIAHWDETAKGHEQEIRVEIEEGIKRCEEMLYNIGRIGSLSLISALGTHSHRVEGSPSVMLATACPALNAEFTE